jgi:glycine hydroxymethyltransferase
MLKIAEFIKLAATDYENNIEYIRNGVADICDRFPLY